MRYNYQTIFGNENGDCFRAALSCLLGCQVEQVPHFFGGIPNEEDVSGIWQIISRWLEINHNCKLFMIPFRDTLGELLKTMKLLNPGVTYMLAADGGLGNHQYIACDDQIIWCPSKGIHGKPVGPCSDGFYWVKVLVRM